LYAGSGSQKAERRDEFIGVNCQQFLNAKSHHSVKGHLDLIVTIFMKRYETDVILRSSRIHASGSSSRAQIVSRFWTDTNLSTHVAICTGLQI
jgi:hypothetical protein